MPLTGDSQKGHIFEDKVCSTKLVNQKTCWVLTCHAKQHFNFSRPFPTAESKQSDNKFDINSQHLDFGSLGKIRDRLSL
jgi:hypothetical protein